MNIFSRKSLTLFALAGGFFFANSFGLPKKAYDNIGNYSKFCVRVLRKTFEKHIYKNLISREQANDQIKKECSKYIDKINKK